MVERPGRHVLQHGCYLGRDRHRRASPVAVDEKHHAAGMAGNLGQYQTLVDQARTLVKQAQQKGG